MDYNKAKELIPEKSFVKYAGSEYRFAGLYPEGHLLHKVHLMIYDEPPSLHVDSINIDSCVALPLNVSVQEEKRELIETPFGAVCEINEGVYGEKLVQDIYMATQGGLGNTPPKPSPAHTEPTTNAGVDKGEGVEGFRREFKELNVYLDALSQNPKDSGHTWIAFADKFRGFEKRILAYLHPLQSDAVEWEKVNDDVPKEKFLLLYNGNWIGVGKCFMVDQPEDEDDGILVPDWVDEAAEYIHPHPTHYMLLPKPPKP